MTVPASLPSNVVWQKSSLSNGDGNVCVEIAFLPAALAMRDSKDPAGGALVVSATAWHAFRTLLTRQ
jgi:hypothetical protein